MKTTLTFRRRATAAFTLVEVLISLSVVVSVLGMAMSTYMMMVRTMYKDNQRLATNASLRSFMAQMSKETLDASCFYLFTNYSMLDGSVDLAADPVVLSQSEDFTDNDYDRWIGHGDCLVLVTKTSGIAPPTSSRSASITGVRRPRPIAMPTPRCATTRLPIRQEVRPRLGRGHRGGLQRPPLPGLATELNGINLNSATSGVSYDSTGTKYNPAATDFSGYKVLTLRTRGRLFSIALHTLCPERPLSHFLPESPSANQNNGFISINVEFINGTSVTNMLSSSSFNYTISPRR